MKEPTDAAYSGSQFFVSDTLGHRILVWNSIPTTSVSLPDFVIGQPNLTSRESNAGGISATSLNTPYGIFATENKLFVADRNNYRVLIYNLPITSNQPAASVVLGQADFVTVATGTTTDSRFNLPYGVFADENKLIVTDTYYNRVLIWNSVPTANNVPASVVIGQADFTTATANSFTMSNETNGRRSLSGPSAAVIADGKLYIADSSNNRMLIWNAVPTANGSSADLVLGQATFNSVSANVTSSRFTGPKGVNVFDGKLFLADSSVGRVQRWDTIPLSSGLPANGVIGKNDFVTSINSQAVTLDTLSHPTAIHHFGNYRVIVDLLRERVSMYDMTVN